MWLRNVQIQVCIGDPQWLHPRRQGSRSWTAFHVHVSCLTVAGTHMNININVHSSFSHHYPDLNLRSTQLTYLLNVLFMFRLCYKLRILRHTGQLGEQLAPTAFCPHRHWKHAVLHRSVLLLQVRGCRVQLLCTFQMFLFKQKPSGLFFKSAGCSECWRVPNRRHMSCSFCLGSRLRLRNSVFVL